MTHPHPRHILVASCLVRNCADELLLVKHNKRGWEVPQGRVEEGEPLLAALHREIHEETGVRISNPQLAVVWSKVSDPPALVHCFIADYASGELRPSEETPEVAWCSVQEARQRIVHPVNRDRLKSLLAYAGQPQFLSYATGPYRLLDDLLFRDDEEEI